MASNTFEKEIKNKYTNPRLSGSFAGINSFIKNRKIKASRKAVERVLLSIPSYYHHRFVKNKFQRRRVFVPFVNYSIQIDLADVSRYSSSNRGVKFLLVALDSFSRFLRVIPIKNKSNKTVLWALKRIINSVGKRLRYVTSDEGKEFVGKSVQDYLKSKNIIWFSSHGGTKQSMVERVIGTLLQRITRFMKAKESDFYLTALPLLVSSYNSTFHSSLNTTPRDVTSKNQYEIFKFLYKDLINNTSTPKAKFNLYQKVFISLIKGRYEKGYFQRVSSRTLRIVKIIQNIPITYELMEENGEKVLGAFYNEELISSPEDGKYKSEDSVRVVESVFRTLNETSFKPGDIVTIDKLLHNDPPTYKLTNSTDLIFEFELEKA